MPFVNYYYKLPINAGKYTPLDFNLSYDGSPLPVPSSVKQAGIDYWQDHLIGFFLDGTLSYLTVTTHLQKIWKLKGSYKVKSDKTNFYFEFACAEDRQKILQSDPIFIRGRMFIISQWQASLDNIHSVVKSVTIWEHFHNIPLLTWTLLGINWLACHLGCLVCFNEATEKLARFEYAKCLIEIEPNKELPEYLLIDEGDNTTTINIEYDWTQLICTTSKCFGHSTTHCKSLIERENNDSDTLERVTDEMPVDKGNTIR